MDLHPGEQEIFRGHPSWRSILGFYLKGLVVALVAGAIVKLVDETGTGILAFAAVMGVVVGVGMLKRVATTYVVTSERLHIKRGIVARKIQETRLDRVQNVNTNQSVLQRLLQVGTVEFDTAGGDDYDFNFAGVADPEQVVRAVDQAHRAAAHRSADGHS